MGLETAALVIGAVAAAAGTSYQVASGERQARVAKRNYRDQQSAQQAAVAKAAQQDFLAQEDIQRARRKKPDQAGILADQASQRPQTQFAGIDPNKLLLGRASALGV